MLDTLTALAWVVLFTGAFLVGVSKTALPGVNTLAVAGYAAILPAKTSTGVLLVLLLLGDAFALWSYRKHAHWPTIIKMAPAVVVGLALGGIFLALADDAWVKRVIGVVLLMLLAFTLWQRRRRSRPVADGTPLSLGVSAGYGSLGGFTTMVANAGGPVMSMYFLSARFPVHAFLGTAAWFFAAINLTKLPISVGLGLVTPATLVLNLWLAPAVVVGAFIGRWITARIQQQAFDGAVLVCTALGAIYLLI